MATQVPSVEQINLFADVSYKAPTEALPENSQYYDVNTVGRTHLGDAHQMRPKNYVEPEVIRHDRGGTDYRYTHAGDAIERNLENKIGPKRFDMGGTDYRNGADLSTTLSGDVTERMMSLKNNENVISYETNKQLFHKTAGPGSFAEFVEARHIMKTILKGCHPVSDIHDRQPPTIGYTFPRISMHEDAPDPYPLNFVQVRPRTSMYSAGNIRSQGHPPKSSHSLKRMEKYGLIMNKEIPSIYTRCDNNVPKDVPMPEDTKFASTAIGNIWSKYHFKEKKYNKEMQMKRRKQKKYENSMKREKNKMIDDVSVFEHANQLKEKKAIWPPNLKELNIKGIMYDKIKALQDSDDDEDGW